MSIPEDKLPVNYWLSGILSYQEPIESTPIS